MTLTTLIVTNVVLGVALVYALAHLLAHSIHADRRHGTTRRAEILALPSQHRDRIAA